jgi:hypothetical protein
MRECMSLSRQSRALWGFGRRVGERLWLAVIILVRLAWPRRCGEQFAGAHDVVDARAAGEQAVVADAMVVGCESLASQPYWIASSSKR